MKTQTKSETVGRTYKQTRWGVHSRRVGGDGVWYGRNNYTTEVEARENFNKMTNGKSQRYEKVGSIVVEFSSTNTLFEYRLVRAEIECEVLSVGEGVI